MKTVVIYGSRHGNTKQIADVVANELKRIGSVAMIPGDLALDVPPEGDLIIIGGPTEAHGVAPPISVVIKGLVPGSLRGKHAAAFETRLNWPRWLSGSAASHINAGLRAAGATVIEPNGSFIVNGRTPVLADGELKRAAEWGRALAARVGALTAA